MLHRRIPIRRIALCILLGTLTSWTMAACIAKWVRKPPKAYHATLTQPIGDGRIGDPVMRARFWSWGCELRSVYPLPLSDPKSSELLSWNLNFIRSGEPKPPRLADWGRFATLSDEQVNLPGGSYAEEAFGWPRPCFWYPVAKDYSFAKGNYAGPGGLNLYPITGKELDKIRALPLLPAYPGLLLNTAFYAGLWSFPLFGLPLLKKRRRRHRGHCPQCNYDLKGALDQGCPECGWKRATAGA